MKGHAEPSSRTVRFSGALSGTRGWLHPRRGGATLTSEGNPRLHLRLDPLLFAGLRARAIARNVTLNELVRLILSEYVKQAAEEKEGARAILRHLDNLVRTLQLQGNMLALQTVTHESGPVNQALNVNKEIREDRQNLHDTVDVILKTLIKLCENEETSKNAKARMDAMQLAKKTIGTDLALLEGCDGRAIQALIDDVKATNDSLKAELAVNKTERKLHELPES